MLKKILLGMLAVGVICFFILLFYLKSLGVFKEVTIEQKQAGPFVLVYEKHVGPYEQTSRIQNKMYFSLKEDGVLAEKGFGLYYDNPKNVAKEELRSIAGCLIKEEEINTLDKEKYAVGSLPESNYVYSEFPFKDKMAIFFAVMKIYPKLSEYLEKGGHKSVPIMEVYDVKNKIIQYYAGTELEDEVFNEFLK